jgi:hypothetical protein
MSDVPTVRMIRHLIKARQIDQDILKSGELNPGYGVMQEPLSGDGLSTRRIPMPSLCSRDALREGARSMAVDMQGNPLYVATPFPHQRWASLEGDA